MECQGADVLCMLRMSGREPVSRPNTNALSASLAKGPTRSFEERGNAVLYYIILYYTRYVQIHAVALKKLRRVEMHWL